MKTRRNVPNAMFLLAAAGLVALPANPVRADVSAESSPLPSGLRPSLILYYDFDSEPVNGTVIDQSGHGTNGLAVNVQFVRDGHRGGAASFGLSRSYITVPNKRNSIRRVLPRRPG